MRAFGEGNIFLESLLNKHGLPLFWIPNSQMFTWLQMNIEPIKISGPSYIISHQRTFGPLRAQKTPICRELPVILPRSSLRRSNTSPSLYKTSQLNRVRLSNCSISVGLIWNRVFINPGRIRWGWRIRRTRSLAGCYWTRSPRWSWSSVRRWSRSPAGKTDYPSLKC